MKKSIFNDKLIIFFIWLVISALFVLTYAKMGSPFVDCGREVYIPEQILKGQVLYKDIFNLYAPAAYLFNALLYKIFSPSINVLYFSAFINYGILNTFLYLILRLFVSKQRSLILSILIIALTGISGNVFNFFFPYSFGMAYGITSVVISIYFLLRGKKESDFYLSAFFAGLSATFKYEFVLYFIPLIIYSFYKIKNIKEIFKQVLVYSASPLLFGFTLIIQGLNINDLVKEYFIIKSVLHSKTMWYFYSITGISFSIDHIFLILKCFIIFFIVFLFSVGQSRILNIIRYFTLFFAAWFLFPYFSYKFFVFIPISLLTLLILRIKELNHKKIILTISALLISAKVFFSLMLFSYGVFFIGLLLVAFLIVLPIRYRHKFLVTLSIFTILLFLFSIETLKVKTDYIATEKGKLYTVKEQSISFMQTYNYLKDNTLKQDKILCLPEEPLMNFMLGRDTDNYLYSLIPMYIEVFGEKNIIGRIEELKPKYIVVNDWNTNSYYFSYFGKDYALGIMQYINENYAKVFETEYGLKHTVYRRKQK